MRDADKAETLVEDERPRIICVHIGHDRVLPKGSIPDTWVTDRSARMKCHVVAGGRHARSHPSPTIGERGYPPESIQARRTEHSTSSRICERVRPDKADMFSGSQSHRRKSQEPS